MQRPWWSLVFLIALFEITVQVADLSSCPNDDLLISISDQPVARVGSDGAVYFLGGICGAGADISVPNLIAWYPFESDFNDDSGNQFNATDSGCGFNSSTPANISSRSSHSAYISDNCTVDLSSVLDELGQLTEGSISFWIYGYETTPIVANYTVDFNTAGTGTNPQGQWSYAHANASGEYALQLGYGTLTGASPLIIEGDYCWYNSPQASYGTPVSGGSTYFPLVGAFWMHPGNPLITTDILGMAIYTVPAKGLYTMFAEVARGHYTYASGPSDTTGGDGVLIQFWHNGAPIGDTFWIAPYFVSYHLYNLTQTVNALAGDTLAFSVHPNGTYQSDTTFIFPLITGSTDSGPILGAMNSDTGAELTVEIQDTILYSVFDPTYTPRQTVESSSSVTDGEWHHVVITSAESTLRLFVDNVEQENWFDNAGPRKSAFFRDAWQVNTFLLGGINAGPSSSALTITEASVDDLAFWDTALPSGAIEQLYNGVAPDSISFSSSDCSVPCPS